MTQEQGGGRRPVAVALAEAAASAGYAPSVHNTQPWRWRAHPDRLDLYAARDRQLTETDPEGRLLLLSCGAALHHARLALARRSGCDLAAQGAQPGSTSQRNAERRGFRVIYTRAFLVREPA